MARVTRGTGERHSRPHSGACEAHRMGWLNEKYPAHDERIEHQLRRCVLPLMAVTGEARWVGIGTAFVVSVVDEGRTALMFTAAHNLVSATTLDPYRRRAAHA